MSYIQYKTNISNKKTKMKGKFERMLEVLDVDFIEDNPNMVLELVDALVHELNARKDVIQLQREELLLLKAMLESNK